MEKIFVIIGGTETTISTNNDMTIREIMEIALKQTEDCIRARNPIQDWCLYDKDGFQINPNSTLKKEIIHFDNSAPIMTLKSGVGA